MKKTYKYVSLAFLNVFYAQELLYDEAGRQLRARRVVCDLGEDNRDLSSTVILDASRSQPSNGSLTTNGPLPRTYCFRMIIVLKSLTLSFHTPILNLWGLSRVSV